MTATRRTTSTRWTRRLPVHAGVRRRRRSCSCAARAPSCGTATGKRYLDFLGRHRRHRRSATPTRWSPRRSPPRPTSCCTSATSSPTPSATRGGDGDRPAAAARSPASSARSFFTNSGAEAIECALKLGPQARRPRPPRRRQRPRQLPRPHARRARRHRPADQARAVPADARGLPPRRVGRRRRDRARPSTRSVARGADRAGAGRGRRQPGAARLPVGDPRASATRTGALMMVDEIQTGFGRTGRVVRLRARRRRSPTSSTLAKAMGNGMPVGACWARTEVAAVFEPGDHGSTYSGTAIATAAVERGDRRDAPHRRARAGRPARAPGSPTALRALPGVDDGPRPGSAARRRAGRRRDAPTVYRALLDRGPRHQRRHADRDLRFAPPLTVSDDEIDEAVGNGRRRSLASMTRATPARRSPTSTAGELAQILDLGGARRSPRSAARSTGSARR